MLSSEELDDHPWEDASRLVFNDESRPSFTLAFKLISAKVTPIDAKERMDRWDTHKILFKVEELEKHEDTLALLDAVCANDADEVQDLLDVLGDWGPGPGMAARCDALSGPERPLPPPALFATRVRPRRCQC